MAKNLTELKREEERALLGLFNTMGHTHADPEFVQAEFDRRAAVITQYYRERPLSLNATPRQLAAESMQRDLACGVF